MPSVRPAGASSPRATSWRSPPNAADVAVADVDTGQLAVLDLIHPKVIHRGLHLPPDPSLDSPIASRPPAALLVHVSQREPSHHPQECQPSPPADIRRRTRPRPRRGLRRAAPGPPTPHWPSPGRRRGQFRSGPLTTGYGHGAGMSAALTWTTEARKGCAGRHVDSCEQIS